MLLNACYLTLYPHELPQVYGVVARRFSHLQFDFKVSYRLRKSLRNNQMRNIYKKFKK